MKILQVSATDFGGGAAKVAWDLHQAYKLRENYSWMVVGKKKSSDENVFQIPNDKPRNLWERINFAVAEECRQYIGRVKGMGRASNVFSHLGRPSNFFASIQGKELFSYPATRNLFSLVPAMPDIVHCHNLHSKYFDLRELPVFSQRVPTVLTLHDTWLLSGHCAYSKTCNRWQFGCGKCPDLSLYPAIRRDNTAENWQIKKRLYQKSLLYVVTPCQWLMQKVEKSMLQPGIQLQKVIHNGVDTAFFKPGNRQQARDILGLDQADFIVFFVANSIRKNVWKDFATLKKSLEYFSRAVPGARVRLICFGDEAPVEFAGHISIYFVPHTDRLELLVLYYQAVDIYVHATKADTFPTVILEALACGLPVIATGVDGVSEQVKSLTAFQAEDEYGTSVVAHGLDEATGALVNRGDAEAIAYWLRTLMNDDAKRLQLGCNARRDALLRFDFNRQVREYLEWYDSCIKNFEGRKAFHGAQ